MRVSSIVVGLLLAQSPTAVTIAFEHAPKNTSACAATAGVSGFLSSNLSSIPANGAFSWFHNTTRTSSSLQLASMSPSTGSVSTEVTSVSGKVALIANGTYHYPANGSSQSPQSQVSGKPLRPVNGTFYYSGNITLESSPSQVSGKPLPLVNGTFHYPGNTTLKSSPSQVSQLPWSTSASNETLSPISTNFSSFRIASLAVAATPAKFVFAHFMVSNTKYYTISDWELDISLAKTSSIDAFVLNMAWGEETNGLSVANGFTAAKNLGFKLFFSFDYAGNGLWKKADVISMINQYKSSGAYFMRGSQPLVSTFEGPIAAQDWPSIKSATDCYFLQSTPVIERHFRLYTPYTLYLNNSTITDPN